MNTNKNSANSIVDKVSSFVAASPDALLPPDVIEKAKHHILDTFSAMVSGSRLKPGEMARRYAEGRPESRDAQVAGSRLTRSAIDAALVNGMMSHADETDDSNA
ncbi:MAG: MmgE/PrpD family protein, partial [Chloroflexota bacterium]